MATIALPRFLEKLRTITETTPPNIASWSADGRQYEIHSPRFETEVLTQHFDAKRSLLSFIRQVSFSVIGIGSDLDVVCSSVFDDCSLIL